MLRAFSLRCFQGTSPATRTSPDVGTRIPVSILMVVDLPAPFGPMYPTSSPGSSREGYVVDRHPVFVFAREKRAQRAEGPRRALAGAKDFAQVARLYDRQDTSVRHCVLLTPVIVTISNEYGAGALEVAKAGCRRARLRVRRPPAPGRRRQAIARDTGSRRSERGRGADSRRALPVPDSSAPRRSWPRRRPPSPSTRSCFAPCKTRCASTPRTATSSSSVAGPPPSWASSRRAACLRSRAARMANRTGRGNDGNFAAKTAEGGSRSRRPGAQRLHSRLVRPDVRRSAELRSLPRRLAIGRTSQIAALIVAAVRAREPRSS